MNSFFRIIDKIKDAISAEPFNNEITFGDLGDIDLSKQSLFPLAHITVNNANITENLVQHNMTVFFMDLVDINNAEDALYGAAKLLAANGASSGDNYSALFSYNHADWYVQKVMGVANSID